MKNILIIPPPNSYGTTLLTGIKMYERWTMKIVMNIKRKREKLNNKDWLKDLYVY